LQEASLAGVLVLPPNNVLIDNVLAGKDAAHIQFCSDVSQGNSQYIHSRQMDSIVAFIFDYYDLPKILNPEYCGDFKRRITGNSPTVAKSAVFQFTSARFAGKCRARSLFNFLRTNGSALAPSDFIPVLESVVASFSDLADLRGSSHEQRRKRFNYYDIVLASLFAAVGKHRTNHISWKEFSGTVLAENIYALAECTTSNDTIIFSRARVEVYLSAFDHFRGNFTGLDLAQLLNYSSEKFLDCQQCSITILERLMEDPLFSSHGEMHAAGFAWFNLIVQDKGKTTASLGRWFKILDINGDGFLDKQDLMYFFDGKLAQVIPQHLCCLLVVIISQVCLLAFAFFQLQANGAVRHQPSFDEVWLQFQDIVPALRMKGRVTVSDSELLRAGGLLFDLFCATSANNMTWRGYN
jgi:hypothetical protein